MSEEKSENCTVQIDIKPDYLRVLCKSILIAQNVSSASMEEFEFVCGDSEDPIYEDDVLTEDEICHQIIYALGKAMSNEAIVNILIEKSKEVLLEKSDETKTEEKEK